jgi:hypothetical protein
MASTFRDVALGQARRDRASETLNPNNGKCRTPANKKTRAVRIQKVLDPCPSAQWRLIVVLARFGGLRCPSEFYVLTWTNVLWDQSRLVIRSPKTGERTIPLFPELRAPLDECFHQAAEKTVNIVTRQGIDDANLRTGLSKILRKAGVKAWPKLFHNLRASRQTELTATFPEHVICAWMGNSKIVARKHYLQVRDEDFERALQNPVQQVAAKGVEPCLTVTANLGISKELRENKGISVVSERGEYSVPNGLRKSKTRRERHFVVFSGYAAETVWNERVFLHPRLCCRPCEPIFSDFLRTFPRKPSAGRCMIGSLTSGAAHETHRPCRHDKRTQSASEWRLGRGRLGCRHGRCLPRQ